MCLPLQKAFCQTHIFDRYASWQNLEVAYLENVPLDSVTSINATIIIAKDSVSWELLADTFSLPHKLQMKKNHSEHHQELRNSKNPERLEHGGIMDCSLLWANYPKSTIIIFHYSSIDQLNSILKYSLKTSTHEEN